MPPYHEFFLSRFWELSTDRQVGMGLGPIPHTSVLAAASRYELDTEASTIFVRAIYAMDEAFLEWSRKKAAKKATSSKPQQNRWTEAK